MRDPLITIIILYKEREDADRQTNREREREREREIEREVISFQYMYIISPTSLCHERQQRCKKIHISVTYSMNDIWITRMYQIQTDK